MYPGPQFSVAGTRRLAGVHDRLIIGTIIKPSVRLSPEPTTDRVRRVDFGDGVRRHHHRLSPNGWRPHRLVRFLSSAALASPI